MPDIGNSIALGNLATPVNDRPITNFANKKLQIDLAERQAAAKARADEAKLQQELNKMIKFGKGGYDPLFQGRAAAQASKSIARQMALAKSGDTLGLNAEAAQFEAAQADLLAENKAFRETVDDLERNGLISKEAARIRNMTGQQAKDFYKKAVVANPELKTVLNYDEANDRFTANYVKGIDLNQDYKELASLLKEDNEVESVEKYKDTEKRHFIAKAESVLRAAQARVQDPDYLSNVIVKNPVKYKQVYDELNKQIAASGKEVDPNAIKMQAAAMVVADNVRPLTKTSDEWRARAPRSSNNLNLSFGQGELKTDLDGNPTNGSIPIKVSDGKGNSINRKVPTGNQFGFAVVEVQNTKGDDYIDLETNMPVTGGVIQSAKMGEVVAVPIATQDFVSPRSGFKIKKGQMIPEQYLKSAKDAGFVQYQPMVKGIAEIKTVDRKGAEKTIHKSVMAPAQKIGDQIILKQSTPDAPATQAQFQKAINETNKLNSGIKTSKKPTKQSAGTIDLSAFDKTK